MGQLALLVQAHLPLIHISDIHCELSVQEEPTGAGHPSSTVPSQSSSIALHVSVVGEQTVLQQYNLLIKSCTG